MAFLPRCGLSWDHLGRLTPAPRFRVPTQREANGRPSPGNLVQAEVSGRSCLFRWGGNVYSTDHRTCPQSLFWMPSPEALLRAKTERGFQVRCPLARTHWVDMVGAAGRRLRPRSVAETTEGPATKHIYIPAKLACPVRPDRTICQATTHKPIDFWHGRETPSPGLQAGATQDEADDPHESFLWAQG